MAAAAQRLYPRDFRVEVRGEELDRLRRSTFVTHDSACAARTHRASEWVMAPTRWFLQAAYGWGNPLSGEDKDCLWWGRAVKAGNGVKAIASALPAAAGLVVGMPLRWMDHGSRPLFGYLDTSKGREPPPAIRLTPDMPLHVRSMNACLTPESVAKAQDVRSPLQRAQELGEAILRDPHPPAVIMVQEGWNEEAAQLLCEIVKVRYPHIIHNVAPQIAGMNSGSMVLSMHPIEEVVFERLKHMLTWHSAPPRGVIRIRLRTEQGPILIYSTHTQSCSGDAQDVARSRQLKQIREMMERDARREPGVHQLLLGDLNTSDYEEDNRETSASERRVLEQLHGAFDDLWLRDHDRAGNRTHGEPFFLRGDNAQAKADWPEAAGSWAYGPKLPSAIRGPWGTKDWSVTYPVSKARFDYVVIPRPVEGSPPSRLDGRVEHRRIPISHTAQSGPSDHLWVDARVWVAAAG